MNPQPLTFYLILDWKPVFKELSTNKKHPLPAPELPVAKRTRREDLQALMIKQQENFAEMQAKQQLEFQKILLQMLKWVYIY